MGVGTYSRTVHSKGYRCCSSTIDKAEAEEGDTVRDERVRAHHQVDRSVAQPRRNLQE